MGKHCCYGLCTSDSRYAHRDYMQGVYFIPFPKPKTNLEKCKRWLQYCRRENFGTDNITKDTYICSKHFVGGHGPTDDNPDPIPATASSCQIVGKKRKPPQVRSPEPRSTKRKLLKDTETVEVQETSSINTSITESTNANIDDNVHIHLVEAVEKSTSTDPSYFSQNIKTEAETQTYHPVKDTNVLTKLENVHLKNTVKTMTDVKPTPNKKPFSIETLKCNKVMMTYYTSLSYKQFTVLLKFLGPAAYKLNYWNASRKNPESDPSKRPGPARKLSPEDELLLTLMRLRRGLQTKDLAYRFQISEGSVTSIVITWIQFMYLQFKRVNWFPSRHYIRKKLPASFKPFKNIRVIVDATEFFCSTPKSDFGQQGNLYSSYKNHTTYKVLIGINPNGAISFVSDAYEGSISDNDIFKQSGIRDKLDPGDLVMADRGFTVKEYLQKRGISLNIPPFLNGQVRLSAQDEARTKAIARVRIHVERAIERIKAFRIFSRVIPLSLQPVFTQMVKVTAALVNFQKPIVK